MKTRKVCKEMIFVSDIFGMRMFAKIEQFSKKLSSRVKIARLLLILEKFMSNG